MIKAQKFSVDLRIVCLVLLALIVGMVIIWKPWTGGVERTIKLNGEASIEAEPDQYTFYPTYEFKGSDRSAIQAQLTSKINEVVTKLRELGVQDSDMTLSFSTYDNFYNDGTNEVASNSLTIIIKDKELAQKVTDYLLSTSPLGTVTPTLGFSSEKQRDLQDTVRLDAIANAREKAERTAKELGARLGKVITVSDPNSTSSIMPYYSSGYSIAEDVSSSKLPVLAGDQTVTYTVEVVYELR